MVWWVLTAVTSVLVRERWRETGQRREKAMPSSRQRAEVHSPEPRRAGRGQKLEEARDGFFPEPPEGEWPCRHLDCSLEMKSIGSLAGPRAGGGPGQREPGGVDVWGESPPAPDQRGGSPGGSEMSVGLSEPWKGCVVNRSTRNASHI